MADGSDTMILYNGKIYLGRGRFAEAVLVRGETIEAVGGSDEIRLAAGAGARAIDCGGRTVLSGFNDSHMHLMFRSISANECDITGASGIDDLISRCRAFIASDPERSRRGIHAVGWNQDLFTSGEKRMPEKRDLDAISTDIPIVLERVCGHVATANTAAIRALGLDRDPAFRAECESGLFAENNVSLINKAVPAPSPEEIKQWIKDSMDYAVSRGITSVQCNETFGVPSKDAVTMRIYRELYADGEAKIRLHHQVSFKDIEGLRASLEDGEFAHRDEFYRGDMLTLGPMKIFRDGSLGARTAIMKDHGYLDDPSAKGVEWSTKEDFEAMCRLAADHGIQIVTHCIGDGGIQDVIDVYEKLERVPGQNPLRNCLIHCQITDKKMLEQIRHLGILTAVQPVFLDYDLHILDDRVGHELGQTSYAFGTMKRSGIHVSFGTDCPVEECDPLPNIYYAVNRCDKNGLPHGGYAPSEKLDVCDAVDCYTEESAYMQFMEDRKGRIKPGHLADMVVLDTDIFTCDPIEIKDIGADMTIVGGEVVYER